MSTKIENRLANVVCQALTLRRKLHPQSTAMLMAYFEGEVLEMRAAFAAFQGLMPGTELIEMFQVMHGIGAEGATHRLDHLHTSLNIIVSESMPALAIEFSPHVIDVKGWVDGQAELYDSLMKTFTGEEGFLNRVQELLDMDEQSFDQFLITFGSYVEQVASLMETEDGSMESLLEAAQDMIDGKGDPEFFKSQEDNHE